MSPCTSLCRNFRYRRLCRRRRLAKQAKEKKVEGVIRKEMKIKNLKLYIENRSIMEENEKLRKKALLLHQENQSLLFQLQSKFSKSSVHHLQAPHQL